MACASPLALRERSKHQEVFLAPQTAGLDHETWLRLVTAWRAACRDNISFTGTIFEVPSIQWARTAFVQPQMHPWSRFFFNETTQQYTAKRYLDDLKLRYGGIDSVLLWPTYPVLGLDDRNQFDLFAAMPGGLSGVAEVVAALHAASVHVLLPYLYWDDGTMPDLHNRTDAVRMAELVTATGADGLNGDSIAGFSENFYTAAVAAGRPIALQSEDGPGFGGYKPNGSLPLSLNWEAMDMGYWGGALGHYTGGGGGDWPFAPAVDKWKLFDTRRITVVSDRWSKNKTNNLQAAFFNGAAYEAWEDVWSLWNQLTPRDGEALRRVATVLRFFGDRGFTQSPEWEPHSPTTLQHGVFASRWPLAGETLWTLVNRLPHDAHGAQLELSESVYGNGTEFYDCYHGTRLVPAFWPREGVAYRGGGSFTLSFAIEAGGYGCVLATTNASSDPLRTYLRTMAKMTAQPLRTYSQEWRVLPQKTSWTPTATGGSLAGMVHIPVGVFDFYTEGVEIECGPSGHEDEFGCDAQMPWELKPQPTHSQRLTMVPFDIDIFPVTAGEYADYLATSGYVPADNHNWLKNWEHTDDERVAPRLPPALARVPVTYVSYAEALDYCQANGKRLPTTWEWQFAAQGNDATRSFPWGAEDDAACRPALEQGRRIPGAPPVGAYPLRCRSVFNVSDLVGHVWQCTLAGVDPTTYGPRQSLLIRVTYRYHHPRADQTETHDHRHLRV